MTKRDDGDDADQRLERLERRLKRAQSARLEAETIADRRMRELYLSNLELDERVAARTRDLELAVAELESTSSAAAGFLANLSHEMRTPLNGIIGMLELLPSHVNGEQGRQYLDTALESSRTLNALVSRLISAAEVGTTSAHDRSPWPLGVIAESIDDSWRLPCLSKGQLLTIRVVGSDGTTVNVPSVLLLQTVRELMSNVVTHADAGVVTIDIRLEPPTDTEPAPMLHLTITDPGPGFDVTHEADLLESVARADTTSTRAGGGLGLGLYLAHDSVRRSGGRMEIVSGTGQPTAIDIRIPATNS